MTTPLALFKGAPRWRMMVLSALVLTVTVILVQPDRQRSAAARQQPGQALSQPAPPKPPASPSQLGSSSSVSTKVVSQKNKSTSVTPSTAQRVRTIQPGTSSGKTGEVSAPAVSAIVPSGGGETEAEVPAEVIPVDEGQNTLIPSG